LSLRRPTEIWVIHIHLMTGRINLDACRYLDGNAG
jgi:hypothetical protein